MSDLARQMREAAARAAADTVAPPFARVERRRRARRVRRAALATAAVVAVGGIAVASPALDRRAGRVTPVAPSPSLKPYEELLRDPEAAAALFECMRETGYSAGIRPPATTGTLTPEMAAFDRCLVAKGYEPIHQTLVADLGRRSGPAAGCPEALRAAPPALTGTTGGEPWQLRVAYEGKVICLRAVYGGGDRDVIGNEAGREPPEPADLVLSRQAGGEALLHGWRDARVTHVEVLVNGETYRTATVRVRGGGEAFYAVAVPGRGPLMFTVRAFDASGARVGEDRFVRADLG